MATVESLGSQEKRSKGRRGGGGVPFATYLATVQRDGQYVSNSVGDISFNAELADPVEQAVMVGWEQTMNTRTNELLLACSDGLQREAKASTDRIWQVLTTEGGLQAHRVAEAARTAARTAEVAISQGMDKLHDYTTTRQRDINRQLQPEILERMRRGYQAAANTEGGKGKFDRMKHEMKSHADGAMKDMFKETTAKMCARPLCGRAVHPPDLSTPPCMAAQAERHRRADPRAAPQGASGV